MSLLEKESGTITMTNPGYAKLTKIFRDKYNIYLEGCLFKAETLYFELKAIKGSGSAERKADHFDAWLSKVDIDEFNLESIKKELFRGKNGGLAKPRKSIVKRLSSRDTQFEITITSDATLSFINSDGRTFVKFNVNSSYGGVSKAKESALYGVFEKSISIYVEKHKWRKIEGGLFHYTCECDDAEGDTDPSVVAWGPRGQKALKDSKEAFLNCLR